MLGKTTTAVVIMQKPIVFLKSDSRKVNFLQSFIGIITDFTDCAQKMPSHTDNPKKDTEDDVFPASSQRQVCNL